LYGAAAAAVLAIHLAWILFVALGAFFTARRPFLTARHIIALVWGIAVEAGPCPCPLTALEQHLQTQAGKQAYTQSFLGYWLDRLVYPDIPESILATAAVSICLINLAVYVRRWMRRTA
jgi:hypothetical protein